MRAEIINETINPEILHPEFKDTQEFDGLIYKASVEISGNEKYFTINVYDGEKRVGITRFKPWKNQSGDYWLSAFITSIHPNYQGKGIASYIYAYAKMMGNTIKPSRDQTDSGREMWQSWEKTGEADHLKSNEKSPELTESDEINELKRLAGITTSSQLEGSNISITGNEKAMIQKEKNIRPGTDEWFKLWFSKPYLTGEKPI